MTTLLGAPAMPADLAALVIQGDGAELGTHRSSAIEVVRTAILRSDCPSPVPHANAITRWNASSKDGPSPFLPLVRLFAAPLAARLLIGCHDP